MTRYRFRYDARGTALESPKPEGARSVPDAPKAASATTAIAKAEESTVAQPRYPGHVIEELKGWLDANPDFGLDMALLEERGVLLAPPHWTYVLELAESPAQEPFTADAWQTVEKYVQMLGDRQEVLDNALQTAAAASVASTAPDRAGRMQDALRALPKGGRIVRESGDVYPPVPPFLPFRQPLAWAERIRERCDALANIAGEAKRDWDALERRGWDDWHTRLRTHRRRLQNFDMTESDLLLRTRGAGPAVLFRNDLQQMTLREWSDAFFLAIQEKLPPPSLLPVPAWVVEEIHNKLLETRHTSLLLVGTPEGSSGQWTPSQRNGSFWIDQTRIDQFLRAFTLIVNSDSIVAFEVAGDAETIARIVRTRPAEIKSLNERFPPSKTTYVFLGKDKLPTHVTPVLPYVENPKDVDDAIAKVRELTRGTSSSPPP